MTEIYRANDGTIFEDEWECRHYEIKNEYPAFYDGRIKAFNEYLEKIPNDEFDDIMYLSLADDEAAKQCFDRWIKIGYTISELTKGYFVYESGLDDFISIERTNEKFTAILKKLTERSVGQALAQPRPGRPFTKSS